MKKFLAHLLWAVASAANAQVFDGSVEPSWGVAAAFNAWRDYGAKDKAGNQPYQTPPASEVKTTTILVLPLRYQSPPSADPLEVSAYNTSLPKVTQENLAKAYAAIPGWWAAESYGTARAVVNVLPDAVLPGKRPCDWSGIVSDASRIIPAGTPRDVTLIVTPYQCWSSNGVGGGGNVVLWGTVPDGVAMVVHETGHALGLLHNASMINGVFNEYGSFLDQMGAGGNHFLLWHLSSDHKNKLGWMTPRPCKSTTLRSFYLYPDAIRCGDYFMEYWPDWGFVAVHKRESRAGPGGGTDSTDYALLSAGQSLVRDGYTFTHAGSGRVVVSP
ncbi:MAG TPA: M12 family metallopeptidase [Casimicrobiaceae bacterium]|nr:M12 family metallopeptidase [Casimicrobiaceae bacterium]